MTIYAVRCGAVQCSSADWNGRDEEKERRGDERRGQGRGGEGTMIIGRSLSLALRIIWLHAIAWRLWGLEWNGIGWNRVEASTGE
jgi:hypothetical protein